jgi:hypothetical protein
MHPLILTRFLSTSTPCSLTYSLDSLSSIMNSDDALRHLAEIKSVEAEKHARSVAHSLAVPHTLTAPVSSYSDSANHPELSGSKVPKYSAAAKASSGTFCFRFILNPALRLPIPLVRSPPFSCDFLPLTNG